MNGKLNIEKIAKRAGVSTATVSRVLNNYPYVKEETRSKVLKIIEKTNYRVNAIARNLRRKKTQSIGVIISNVLSPFYSKIAKAVEDVAINKNYSTILCNGGDNPDKEYQYLKLLHENRVDGIIISPTGKNIDYINFLISAGIPIVFIDRYIDGVDCDAVIVNNFEASYNAVNHVINKGYKKIAFISGPLDRFTGRERYRGYIKALEDNSIKIDENIIRYGDFTLESGFNHCKDLLENEDIDMIYIANSDMGTGAFQAIRKKGIKVPKDLGFMMFDEPNWATLVEPSITTISQPVFTLGSTACDLLFRRILRGDRDQIDKNTVKISLDAKLIVRKSI